jgi:hypothetical protein
MSLLMRKCLLIDLRLKTRLPVLLILEAGEYGQVAVKVINDRGNELMVVKNLKEVS